MCGANLLQDGSKAQIVRVVLCAGTTSITREDSIVKRRIEIDHGEETMDDSGLRVHSRPLSFIICHLKFFDFNFRFAFYFLCLLQPCRRQPHIMPFQSELQINHVKARHGPQRG